MVNEEPKMEVMSHEELTGLSRLARSGDIRARNRIVEANMGLADVVFRKTLATPMESADRRQWAYLGIMKAAANYDPDCGERFSTYAVKAGIRTVRRGAAGMLMLAIPEGYLDGRNRKTRFDEDARKAIDVASRRPAPLSPSSAWHEEDHGSAIDHAEELEAFRSAIDSLPARLRDFMRLRADGRGVEFAARAMNMSKTKGYAADRMASELIRDRMGS